MNALTTHNLGLLILRVGFSAMLLNHGIEKFEILLASEIKFADPIGLGQTLTLILVLIAEIISPILILIGFKARWASIPPILLMLVAIFVVHQGDSLFESELAILYLLAFSTIALLGSGRFSVKR